MFWISEMNNGTPKTIWMPVDATDTLYVGQLVASASDGVLPLGVPDGPNNTDGAAEDQVPFGVVVGTNYRTEVYDSAWKTQSITGVAASATQDNIEKVGGHGQGNAVGDYQAKVEVAIITPETVISGPIYNAAYGTAPSTFTLTVASSDGGITAPTGATTDFTPVGDLATMFGRTGNNAGAMRVTTDTSTTQPTVTHGFPAAALAVGDTFVRVNCRLGLARIYTDAEGMYIDNSAALTEHYWNVIGVGFTGLEESGKERFHFMFAVDAFLNYALAQT